MSPIADNLTNTGENRALDWIMGTSTTAPTTPLKVALVTANGSDTAAGTEVAGGSYARKNLTVAATVVGVEVWDSAGTPVRLWYGALAASRTVASGDELRIPAASLTFALS